MIETSTKDHRFREHERLDETSHGDLKGSELVNLTSQFLDQAKDIWDQYRLSGPGTLDRQLFATLDSLNRQLDELNSAASEELQSKLDGIEQINELRSQLLGLAQRCVMRSEGLCFISGEAGLLPRRDLHEKYEGALAELRLWVESQSRNDN